MKFSISFDKRDKKKLYECFDKIIETNKWTEGYYTELFEEKWSVYNNLNSVAFSSWSGGALAAMEYYNLRNKTILCPSNTFMATPLACMKVGAEVKFVDCNKNDLCLSFDDLKKKVEIYNPSAVWIVHIGGHIAFDIEEITAYCKRNGIILLEDCAHAHGAEWKGKKAGEWGNVGVYSFYATKTITTGEGGMLVSKDNGLIEFAKKYRNYGKFDFEVQGLNFRINEFAAAIGTVQVDRLKDIIDYKNEYALELNKRFSNRVIFPEGMISGYYKYIVFDAFEKSTGKVYDSPCHRILKREVLLPNTDWVAENHWCVPIYYDK